MSVTIRKATPEDAASVAQIHIQSWRETYTGIVPQSYLDSLNVETRTANWTSHLQRKGSFDVYLALLDGQAVGIAAGGKRRETETAATYQGELFLVYVLQSAKGKGIGRILTKKVAGMIREDGLRGAMLWVLERNPSKGFYEHVGGKEVARKTIEIGGAELVEVMYAWDEFDV
ncbi:hypothetical protein K4F52_000144 [Lecanicillium sp. MT-2017a]|nr:hypothetical protein K4F52_000144 [Lecanicillium sp. MT-2017a]